MSKDLLVILIFALGFFAIFMFILFFVYLKKYYTEKHINYDYQNDFDEKIGNAEEGNIDDNLDIGQKDEGEMTVEKNTNVSLEKDIDMDFIPIKKK